MISIITYGRNDNYGFNLGKRTAGGFNGMAEVLTEEDEIIFTDYNTPAHLPTLPEYIWDTLTEKALRLIKVVRILPEVHKRIKADSTLPVLENVSRNAAIARSNPANRWMLSTNPDIIPILASQWRNLDELLATRPDSFYEMPRFDIPESIWSSLSRNQPAENMRFLREWLVANRAALAETVPDPRFQKFFLFDAPGDFQLAPRSYFFRLRGFDESMNKYLHSDSNLAKRMWLLNKERTDHLLGDLWIAHQDHYLSGEWAKNASTIVHNDYLIKVLHQKEIEVNDENWGLQNLDLPVFRLEEKIKKVRSRPLAVPGNGKLDLSEELDWNTQPYYRLCHYRPHLISLYFREFLQLMSPRSQIVYVGEWQPTFERIQQIWEDMYPDGLPAGSISTMKGEEVYPDLLLVDFYYRRPEYTETMIRLWTGKIERQFKKQQISEEEFEEKLASLVNGMDSEQHYHQLVTSWRTCFHRLKIRPNTYVVLLGCTTGLGVFQAFKEFFEQSWQSVPEKENWRQKMKSKLQRVAKRMGWQNGSPGSLHFTDKSQHMLEPLTLRYLYMHHRLLIMLAEPREQNTPTHG